AEDCRARTGNDWSDWCRRGRSRTGRGMSAAASDFISIKESIMELQQHDLHHEFPEYKDAIHQLKTGNHHFSKLFDEYHRVNKDIRRIEENEEPVMDEALEDMKKE